ncbi:MAG: hypothetical protein EBT22_04650 [Chloroflexi bacterium]|nr:hypothetical protein [Chloroflexota bacterium]
MARRLRHPHRQQRRQRPHLPLLPRLRPPPPRWRHLRPSQRSPSAFDCPGSRTPSSRECSRLWRRGSTRPLLTGQVDVITGLVTNQVISLEGAGESIGYVPYSDLGFGFYWNTPFALDETISQKKDLLIAWTRATARGWDYAIRNPDETAKVVVDKYGEGLKLDNQLLELKRETPLIQTDFTKQKGLLWMDRAVWQSGHDILLNRTKQLEKALNQALNLDDVMTLDILDKVGKIGA